MHSARSPGSGLTRVDFELTPRAPHARRRSALWLALLVTASVAAFAVASGQATLPWAPPAADVRVSAEPSALLHQLEQMRMQLRLSEARSRELEHQIDALNQRVREGQEQLTFFRSARAGKS